MNNYWIRSGFFSVLQRLSTVILGFGSFAILVRFLDKEDFGIYVLFISVTSLIEVARIGLIQNGLIKFLNSEKEEEHADIISSSFILNIIISTISVILLIIIAPLLGALWNSDKIVTLFYLYSITAVVLIIFHQLNFLQQANLNFKGFFFTNLVRHGSFFLLILLEVFIFSFKPDLNRLVVYMTISAMLGSITSIGFSKKYFLLSRRINYEWIKKLFRYGKFVFGTNISSMIFGSIDQFMIGTILPTSSVALFNAANRVNNLINIPVASAAAIVFPQSAKNSILHGKESSKLLYEKSVGILLALFLPALLIIFLFAEVIITIIAGIDYIEAADILKVIVITSLFYPFVRQFGTIMDSIGKPKINFYLLLIVSMMNIISNYIFITKYGKIGAAFGTLLTMSIFTLLTQIILKRTLGVQFNSIMFMVITSYKELALFSFKAFKSLKLRLAE